MKSWDQQNDLVIRGFCYIRPLYNEVPLYLNIYVMCFNDESNAKKFAKFYIRAVLF